MISENALLKMLSGALTLEFMFSNSKEIGFEVLNRFGNECHRNGVIGLICTSCQIVNLKYFIRKKYILSKYFMVMEMKATLASVIFILTPH